MPSAFGQPSDAPLRQSVEAVFCPGTNIPLAAADLIDKLNAQMGYGPKVAAE